MRKIDSIRFQIYLLVISMAISAVLILVSAAKGVAYDKHDAAVREASAAEQGRIGFVLGEYEGKLALYREHSEKPYRILDIELYLLPEEDQRTIANGGILVDTEEELRALLEDWDA